MSDASSQEITTEKSDWNIKIENRASEFLHDTINARDLLDSGILCSGTEEDLLLTEPKQESSVVIRGRPKKDCVSESQSDMPQVVSGSQQIQKEKKYQCATCFKKFPDMSSLKRHVPVGGFRFGDEWQVDVILRETFQNHTHALSLPNSNSLSIYEMEFCSHNSW